MFGKRGLCWMTIGLMLKIELEKGYSLTRVWEFVDLMMLLLMIVDE